MTKLSRLFPVIYSEKLEETKEFYCRLLGFRVEFDSDWFVDLAGGASGEYGQRHFMCVDPNGVLVDVGMPIEPSDAFKAEYPDSE